MSFMKRLIKVIFFPCVPPKASQEKKKFKAQQKGGCHNGCCKNLKKKDDGSGESSQGSGSDSGGSSYGKQNQSQGRYPTKVPTKAPITELVVIFCLPSDFAYKVRWYISTHLEKYNIQVTGLYLSLDARRL